MYRGGALPSILPTGADVSNESMAVVELPKAASIDRSASFFLSSLFLDLVLLSLRALGVTSTQQRLQALHRGRTSCRSSKKEALAKASGNTAAVARVSPAFQSRGRHSSFPADPSRRVQTVRSVGARRVLLRWSRRCTDKKKQDLDCCDRRHLVQALADGELDGSLVLQLFVQVGHLDGEAFHASDR